MALSSTFSNQINSIILDSESIFLTLGKISPLFVEELHENLASLEQSISAEAGKNSAVESLSLLFFKTKELINKNNSLFSEMHSRGSLLLKSLSNSLDRLRTFEKVVFNIRNDSEDMALISLNALTGALKSGRAGRGFSVITEELKKLSDQTKSISDFLQTESIILINQLTEFTEELQKLEQLQQTVFSGLDETITNQFTLFEKKVKALTESFYSLITESKTLEDPISAIMETVQLQDIMRQSLDHILIALEEYSTIQTDANIDKLELLITQQQLLSLAEVIMDDVIKHLEKAVLTFETAFQAIQKLIRKGEKQRTLLLREHFSVVSENSILMIFEQFSKTLASTEQNLSNYMTIKQAVASQGSRVSNQVASITKQYAKFDKIINRFRIVDVAARIEISKQTILQSIKNTVLTMTDLISRITLDVEEAKKVSISFIEDTNHAIQEYSKTYSEEIMAFTASQRELVIAFSQFSQYREDLEQNTRNFTLFSETFLQLLDTQANEIENIKGLIPKCKQIRDYFLKLRQEIPPEIGGNEIQNQHLKDIINKFTIYAHKQAAAEIGNFIVNVPRTIKDVDLTAGEITFF